jgi:hypothetical protein
MTILDFEAAKLKLLRKRGADVRPIFDWLVVPAIRELDFQRPNNSEGCFW